MKMDGNEEHSAAMDVPELIPMEDYDAKQAKLEASISWLITKAYGKTTPKDCIEQFYIDKHGERSLKPCIVNGLTSAEIYCRACSNIFHDSSLKWEGHSSIIQALSRKGIYVMDPSESAVTDSVLAQKSPFKLHSHLALIDALMTAFANETVTIERVVQAVRKFATFNASSELPYDTEDALLFWINKVCSTVRHRLQKAQGAGHGIPVMDDVLKDVNDGCCLATLCSFYCPSTLSLHDIALKDDCGIADSMYNLQLVIQFCENLPMKCLHLSLNDLFYTMEDLKRNLVVFLSELFYWFEVNKAQCVVDVTRQEVPRGAPQPVSSEGEVDDGERPSTAKKIKSASTSRPPVPISAATKKSFQQADAQVSSSSTPDLRKASTPGSSGHSKHQPLLPKRQNPRSPNDTCLRRCNSLGLITSVDEDAGHRSIQAWEEASEGEPGLPGAKCSVGEPRRAVMSSTRTSLLTNVTKDSQHSDLLNNVSIDSSMSIDVSGSSSIDVSELEDTPRRTPIGPVRKARTTVGAPVPPSAKPQPVRVTDPQHQDYMELESVSSDTSRGTNAATSRQTDPVEPLMPAQLKPSKEKTNNQTKEVESGEKTQKKSPTSPTRNPKAVSTKHLKQAETNADGSDSDSTSEEYQTPSVESVPLPGTMNESPKRLSKVKAQPSAAPTLQAQGKRQVTEGNASQSIDNIPTSRASSTFDRNNPLAQSFTLHGQGTARTPEEAVAIGIPVVDDYRFNRQHPGSILRGERSDRSSSEGSDPELRKIHKDHKEWEKKASSHAFKADSQSQNGQLTAEPQRPVSLNVTKRLVGPGEVDGEPEKPSPRTSFAEIKKQKDNGEVSPVIYRQPNSQSAPPVGSLRDQFQKSKTKGVVKKTTFAALPNQTSWQETAQRNALAQDSNKEQDDSVQPLASELINIRMRLEERRRQIETDKHRMEMQWNKQRQRVGKQAFIQVVTKGKSNESSPSDSAAPDQPGKLMTRSAEEPRYEVTSRNTERRASGDVIPIVDSDTAKSQDIPQSTRETSRQGSRSSPKITAESRAVPQEVQSSSHSAKPRSREPSGEKEQRRSTPPLDRLQERLRSESPQSRAGERASSASPPVTKFRDNIQQKIDTVRKRWFPDGVEHSGEEGEGGEMTPPTQRERPKSYHAPLQEHTMAVEQPFGQIHGSPIRRPALEGAHVDEYGSSLDRLNSSLTELQGEIMRLSLQQDQIKCMVSEPRNSPTMGVSGGGKMSESSDQFYLFPRGGGEPDMESERPPDAPPTSQPETQAPPPPVETQPEPPPPQSTQPVQQPAPVVPQSMYQPSGHPGHPLPMYPGQTYPGYTQVPSAQYAQFQTGMYPQQYPGMPPQGPYQAAPGMYQPQMYPPGHPMQAYPMYGQGQWQQPMPGMGGVPPHTIGFQPAPTYTVSSNQTQPVQSPGQVTSPETIPTTYVQSNQSASSPFSPPHSTPPVQSPASVANHSQPSTISNPVVNSPSSSSPTKKVEARSQPHEDQQMPYSYAEENTDNMDSSNEGFFVSFESDTPKKPKPKLKEAADRKKQPSKQETTETEAKAPCPIPPAEVEPPAPVAPGILLVIGHDEQKITSTEQAEIEKKKQKLMQLQIKRKEDIEKKRLKLEIERAKKREEQRNKEEITDAKKAEDRSRREQIFQSYVQRKAEREAEEEMSKAGMAPVKKRAKPKGPRPKSQPPGSLGAQEDAHSHSSQSHSSQEDIHTRGRSPAPDLTRSLLDHRKKRHSTGHLGTFPSADNVDTGFPLAFGGLTHRRPPTPDRLKNLPVDADGNGNGPHKTEHDYSGPRLFVKPSQKSNRNIIMNAVSHCCLAGTVNNDVKEKVLDIMEKSEAKHFLILFRDAGQQFRGLYTYNPDKEEVFKIHGVGPKQITPNMFERFYKYNSGAKTFSQISTTKHLTATIDAVTIPNTKWQKKPPAPQQRKPPMY